MKIIILLVVSFLIFLSGCTNTCPEVTPVTTGLKFNAEISYLNNTYKSNVKIDENGNLEMSTDSAPQIKYFFSGDKITLTHNEISHETEISSLQNGLTLDFLYSVFKSLSKSGEKTLTDKDKYYIKYDTEKYKYTCFFGMSGLPIKITESNFGITVLIKDATIIKPN